MIIAGLGVLVGAAIVIFAVSNAIATWDGDVATLLAAATIAAIGIGVAAAFVVKRDWQRERAARSIAISAVGKHLESRGFERVWTTPPPKYSVR